LLFASADGFIVREDHDWRAGNYVGIRYTNGIESMSCDLSKFLLRCNDLVFASDRITIIGATGTTSGLHLRFAIKVNRKFIDPESLLKEIVGYYNKVH
jgi:murein DD-endopeptidase MepM/ murein hydrolase activator NlpD